jgi:hypothetical protein
MEVVRSLFQRDSSCQSSLDIEMPDSMAMAPTTYGSVVLINKDTDESTVYEGEEAKKVIKLVESRIKGSENLTKNKNDSRVTDLIQKIFGKSVKPSNKEFKAFYYIGENVHLKDAAWEFIAKTIKRDHSITVLDLSFHTVSLRSEICEAIPLSGVTKIKYSKYTIWEESQELKITKIRERLKCLGKTFEMEKTDPI